MELSDIVGLRSVDYVQVVSYSGGGYAVGLWVGDVSSLLTSNDRLVLYPDELSAADDLRHVLRDGVSIQLALTSV